MRRGLRYTGINIEDLRKLPVELPPIGDMEDSLIRATSWYHDSEAWKRLQRRAMRDFGWNDRRSSIWSSMLLSSAERHLGSTTGRQRVMTIRLLPPSHVTAATAMISQLASDHLTAARTAHQAVSEAEASGDVATADLATQRIAQHEKVAWMLRSFLQ